MLPKSLQNEALNIAHAEHLGLSKAKALMREKSWQGSIYWGAGRSFPSPKKSFPEKKIKLFQIKIFIDNDFKESVKVTNVQICDFSQS